MLLDQILPLSKVHGRPPNSRNPFPRLVLGRGKTPKSWRGKTWRGRVCSFNRYKQDRPYEGGRSSIHWEVRKIRLHEGRLGGLESIRRHEGRLGGLESYVDTREDLMSRVRTTFGITSSRGRTANLERISRLV